MIKIECVNKVTWEAKERRAELWGPAGSLRPRLLGLEGGRRLRERGQVQGHCLLIPEKPEFHAQQPMTTTSKDQLGGGGGQQEALKTRSLKGTPTPQHLSASKWQEPGWGRSGSACCPYQLPLRGAWPDTGCPSAAHVCPERRKPVWGCG